MQNTTQGNSDSSPSPLPAGQPQEGAHVLLTVLGKSPKTACYAFGDQRREAELAPVALLDLLPDGDKPDRVLALCTPEAQQSSWPLLERALNGRYQVELVPVSGSDDEHQVNNYLETVVNAVPFDAKITVDVTHGFRHFSFLTYIAVLYLAALRGVEVRGAYYGLLNPDGPSPFLDLRPLLKLPGWIHALQVMDETGSTLPMAKALKDGLHGKSATHAEKIERDLMQLSQGYLSGLPIELGQQARFIRERSIEPLRKLLTNNHRLPLGKELADRFDHILKPLALVDTATQGEGSRKREGWKQHVMLSKCELQRQARLIDDLLRRGNVATALGLLSEWTTSWVVWREMDHRKKQWLDYNKVRRRAANLLGTIRALSAGDLKTTLTSDLRELGVYWQALSDLRNGYAHHGMRPQVLVGDAKSKEEIKKVRQYWETTLRQCPRFSLSLGEERGRILVSPIGMRPGVLFSALQACRAEKGGGEPALCLVICSQDTKGKIAEAVEQAEYRGEIKPLLLQDPYGGSDEIKHLETSSRRYFIGASEVVVNVTGGTTLMGLAAETLASTARRLACPVRRFGLIDRRAPHEQEADPYKVGETFWIDPPVHNDDNDDADGD